MEQRDRQPGSSGEESQVQTGASKGINTGVMLDSGSALMRMRTGGRRTQSYFFSPQLLVLKSGFIIFSFSTCLQQQAAEESS